MLAINWKQVLPLIFTASVLSAVVWWTQTRPVKTQKPDNPDSVVWKMADSCREGDVNSYLSCFSDEWRKRLEKVREEIGDEKFRAQLQQMQTQIKNIAVWSPKPSPSGDWEVTVDFVFADRNEQQTFKVRKIGSEWKIVDIEATKPVPVLIPYGTPVKGL